MKEMKIGYDAKRFFYNDTGLGNYSRTLVNNYKKYIQQEHLYLFTPGKAGRKADILEGGYHVVEGPSHFYWRIKGITKDIERYKLDLFHGLSNELPLGIQKLTHLKKVVTIHDLIFLRFPQFYPLLDRKIYSEKSKRACLSADTIIAISECTKQDIISFYGISDQKIKVLYQACDDVFYSNEKNNELPVQVMNIETPYFLFVGTHSQRKNLITVLKAMAEIPKAERPILVIVGPEILKKSMLFNFITEHHLQNNIIFTGYINKTALKSLYEQAAFLLYPSLYEGFGLPVVEAMLSGTRVVTSHLSSMPEAASGMAILINPLSVADLKNQILNIHSFDPLSPEAINQVKDKYNPEQLSAQLADIYNQI